MSGWLERALTGRASGRLRHGEPGIGKTTLVDARCAMRPLRAASGWRGASASNSTALARRTCPCSMALSRLGRTSDGARLTELLRQHAPTWLLELPSLLPAGEREALRQQVPGATRERMLRELAERSRRSPPKRR